MFTSSSMHIPANPHKTSLSLCNIFLVLLAVLLFPYLCISIYTEPIADDYAMAIRLTWRTFMDAYVHEYFSWNGQYVSNLFQLAGGELIDSKVWFKTLPVLTILTLVGSVYVVLKTQMSRRMAWVCSLGAILCFLGSLASLSELIYWNTAVLAYTVGIMGTCWMVAALIRLQQTNSRYALIAAITAILFATGCSAMTMSVVILIAILYTLLGGRKWKWILITAVIAASILIFAPGNTVRAAHFSDSQNFWYSFGMSLLQTVRFTAITVFYLPVWVLAIFIWKSTGPGTKSNIHELKTGYSVNFKNILSTFKTRIHFVYLAIAFGPLFLASFLPYYATGILGQHRTPGVGQFYLIAAILFLPFFMHTQHPITFQTIRQNLYRIPRLLLLITFIISYALQGNSHALIADWTSGRLSKQSDQLQHRAAAITAATADTTLYFPPLDTTVLFVIDITENPDYWINKHQARVLNEEFEVGIVRE